MVNLLENHNFNGIDATVIACSQNEWGDVITSVVMTFPRFILAELNTHRIMSRNSASSRAIPFKKMVKMALQTPFIPLAFQKDHKGMQGTEYLDPEKKYSFWSFEKVARGFFQDLLDDEEINSVAKVHRCFWFIEDHYRHESRTLSEWWLLARDRAVECAIMFHCMEVTKQIANRLLEPFMWHTVLVTATDWSNFFGLRSPSYEVNVDGAGNQWFASRQEVMNAIHERDIPIFDEYELLDWLKINKGLAEIHMSLLAEEVYNVVHEAEPVLLTAGQWHTPFAPTATEVSQYLYAQEMTPSYNNYIDTVVRVSTARCARVSFLNFDGDSDFSKDFGIFRKLVTARPIHASPSEHVAQSMSASDLDNNLVIENGKTYPGRLRNFTGFTQLRVLIERGEFQI